MTQRKFSECGFITVGRYLATECLQAFESNRYVSEAFCSVTGVAYATYHESQLQLAIENAAKLCGYDADGLSDFGDSDVPAAIQAVTDTLIMRNMATSRTSPSVFTANGNYFSQEPVAQLIIVLKRVTINAMHQTLNVEARAEAMLELIHFADAFMELPEEERLNLHGAAIALAATYDLSHYRLTAAIREKLEAAIEAQDFAAVYKALAAQHARLDKHGSVRLNQTWESETYQAMLNRSIWNSNVYTPEEKIAATLSAKEKRNAKKNATHAASAKAKSKATAKKARPMSQNAKAVDEGFGAIFGDSFKL